MKISRLLVVVLMLLAFASAGAYLLLRQRAKNPVTVTFLNLTNSSDGLKAVFRIENRLWLSIDYALRAPEYLDGERWKAIESKAEETFYTLEAGKVGSFLAGVPPYATNRPWRTSIICVMPLSRFQMTVNNLFNSIGFDKPMQSMIITSIEQPAIRKELFLEETNKAGNKFYFE